MFVKIDFKYSEEEKYKMLGITGKGLLIEF